MITNDKKTNRMKKMLLSLLAVMLCASASAQGQVKEKLSRAPVAVMTSQGVLVSWRYLQADGNAEFSLYRDGLFLDEHITDVTNYLDADGRAGAEYKVVSSNGDEAT